MLGILFQYFEVMKKYGIIIIAILLLLPACRLSAQSTGNRVGFIVHEFAIGGGLYNDGYYNRPVYSASYLLGRYFDQRWFGEFQQSVHTIPIMPDIFMPVRGFMMRPLLSVFSSMADITSARISSVLMWVSSSVPLTYRVMPRLCSRMEAVSLDLDGFSRLTE